MSQLPSRRIVTLILPLLVLFGVFFHLYSPERVSNLNLPAFQSFSTIRSNCLPDIEHLNTLHLSPEIHYARLDFNVGHDDPPSNQQLDINLPPFKSLLPRNADPFERHDGQPFDCHPPLTLNFPKQPPKPDLSYITFGLATTIERMEDSMDAFAHWITGTNAVMLAYLEPNSTDSEGADRLRARAKEMGFTMDIQESDLEHMNRYFALVRVMYERRSPKTKWAIILDDDTFFMGANQLHDFLTPIDASKRHYIGGFTDSFQQAHKYGLIGSGGASIMLSMPTLEELQPDEVFGRCLANNLEDPAERFSTVFSQMDKHSGDIMVANCIHLHTAIKFTPEHSLHQLDMTGDMSGIYEGFTNPDKRQRPLTLHHWKSWHKSNMTNMAAVAPACGDECVLQRWKFANDWWLTNGYSIVKYSDDLPVGDQTIERTWEEIDDYRHSFTPLRHPDPAKVSLRLEGVKREGNQVRQFYVRRKGTMEEVIARRNLDEVLELVWNF